MANVSDSQQNVSPFYFKSYDQIIGIASNLKELASELKRLSLQNPKAVEYHLANGHITAWLQYVGEKDLAYDLQGVKTVEVALLKVQRHMEDQTTVQRMKSGRMH